ncbi:MAG TPA: SseB family protein [Rudaea sp.]|nr:SseB family protein [Rudaea sp.]
MQEPSVPDAHLALALAKEGRISGAEMLSRLAAGHVVVPTSEMPRLEGNTITGWRPATLSRADGSQWLAAFTTSKLASDFCDAEPTYGFYVEVSTRWLLATLPEGYGIVFNLRTPFQLDWNPQGLAKYRRDVLGSV